MKFHGFFQDFSGFFQDFQIFSLFFFLPKIFFFFFFSGEEQAFSQIVIMIWFSGILEKKKKKKKSARTRSADVLLNIFSDESPPRFARIAIRQLRYFSGKNKKKKSWVRTGVALRAYRLP